MKKINEHVLAIIDNNNESIKCAIWNHKEDYDSNYDFTIQLPLNYSQKQYNDFMNSLNCGLNNICYSDTFIIWLKSGNWIDFSVDDFINICYNKIPDISKYFNS